MWLGFLLFMLFSGSSFGEVKNGSKATTPSGVEIPVEANDLRIVERAEIILHDPSKWNRKDNRKCPEKASVEINGEFDHRLGALEEVRRTVEEFSVGKNYEHRLMDCNNDPKTTFEDIQAILETTKKKIKRRLHTEATTARMPRAPALGPAASPFGLAPN